MPIRFTDLAVQSLKPGLYFDDRTPAFGIRVGTNRKTWLVVKGENRTKVRLGHYPSLSLADARKKALVTLGSPMASKVSMTFPEALEVFLSLDRWRDSSRRVLKSSLGHFTWKRTLDKISHEDVASALDAIEGSSARAHALKDIRTFFNWCVPRYLPSSPCMGLKMETQPSRDRVLASDELKAVWKAAALMGYPFGTIVQLLILTGQRKMEIGLLRREYIHDGYAVLPAITTKNGREHAFPIGKLAGDLVKDIGVDAGFLFLATGSKTEPYNGYTFHLKQLQNASNTSGWTLHDLRRTFATNLASHGIPIHVTEKLLNHISGSLAGVAGIYNRHSYFEEMKAAAEGWEERLQAIVRD